jgi:hypothetical protein
MLRVPLTGLVGGDVGFGTLPERHGFGRLELRSSLAGLTSLKGVNSFLELLPARCGLAARVGETDIGQRAQAHRAGPAIEHEPEQPGPRPNFRDLKGTGRRRQGEDLGASLVLTTRPPPVLPIPLSVVKVFNT